ncbi:MAG: hypothetical protein VX644_05070 [Planctomycetota bacterium]|nr:hypothetical protein [Planctomycetota bacterium]
MNSRTRFLLTIMIAVGVLYFGDMAYRHLIVGPARTAEREANNLNQKINQTQDLIFSLAEAPDRLATLEQYSLPYRQELAQSRYQDWLLSLVKTVKLTQPGIDAAPPVPVSRKSRTSGQNRTIYTRYPFALRGRGTLQQVTNFLYQFYQAGHLHKIRSMTLTPRAGGSQLDVIMSIEALGLAGCERQDELSSGNAGRLGQRELRDYLSIVRRNIFSRDAAETLGTVMLTAITFDGAGKATAWFSTGPSQDTQVLHRGNTLQVTAHQVRVIDIQTRLALVEVDGQVITLNLGQTLQEGIASSRP